MFKYHFYRQKSWKTVYLPTYILPFSADDCLTTVGWCDVLCCTFEDCTPGTCMVTRFSSKLRMVAGMDWDMGWGCWEALPPESLLPPLLNKLSLEPRDVTEVWPVGRRRVDDVTTSSERDPDLAELAELLDDTVREFVVLVAVLLVDLASFPSTTSAEAVPDSTPSMSKKSSSTEFFFDTRWFTWNQSYFCIKFYFSSLIYCFSSKKSPLYKSPFFYKIENEILWKMNQFLYGDAHG